MDTPELIYAAQKGNLQAFNRLIRDYGDLIYRILSRGVLTGEEADALAQIAIRSFYKKLPGYRGDDFRLWIIKNLVNFCRSSVKRNHSRSKHPQGPGTGEQTLQGYLSGLPVEDRLVVILVDLEKLDYKEAAMVLGIPLKAVQIRLARARRVFISKHSGWTLDQSAEIHTT
jgi:DNA-directed RNA polymerase specialized sigma24 family protein